MLGGERSYLGVEPSWLVLAVPNSYVRLSEFGPCLKNGVDSVIHCSPLLTSG